MFTPLNILTWIVIMFLLGFGLYLLSDKNFKSPDFADVKKRITNTNLSLKDKIDIINGKNSGSKVNGYFLSVKMTLAKMNKLENYRKLQLIAALLALVGALIAVAIKNYFLLLLFPPIGFILPFQYVKIRYARFKKSLEEDLETAISLITISYSRTSNLISAVEECLPSLPPNIKVYFEDFIFEVTSVNANIKTALLNLKVRIDNSTFQQWIDRLIVCQSDRSAIPSLELFINEYADNRMIQNELDSEIYSAKVELYMMCGFVFVAPMVLFVMQRDAFNHLTHDLIGKAAMFIALLLVVFAIVVGNKLAKPVKFRENKE